MTKKILSLICLSIFLIITYSCEKEVFTGITESEKNIYTKVFIDSNPHSSRIFVDGRNMGLVTPDTVKWLSEGAHNITLKNQYFQDTSIAVSTNMSSTSKLVVDYHNNPIHYGRLECRTSPAGAIVYINGERQTLATNIVFNNLFAGKYKVRFSKKDFRDDSLDVDIYGNRITRIYRVLEDSSDWVIYNTNNSKLSGNNAYAVMVDDSNVKWFSTNNGLSIFLNNNWIDITELTSAFVNKKTTRIVSDKSNNIWIGTSNGLFKYHNSSLIDYSSSLPSTKVNDLEITNNTLWVATDNGLVKYSGGTWTVYNTDNSGLSSNIVTTVCIAATGQIWIGTKAGGINRYYNEKWTHFNMNNMGLPKNVGNTINDIVSDGSGNLWVAHQAVPSGESSTTEFGGFTKFNGSSWSVIEISGIAQEQIQKLYSDNFSNIWLCSKSGLGKYSITSSSLTTFTTNNSKLPNPSVTDVIIDNNQDVWLTTDGGGVVKIKKGNY